MITRPLGATGLTVNAVGLGCMGLSEFYDPPVTVADGVKLIHAALDRGVNHLDTAEMYGMGKNEELLAQALAGKRDQVVLATKFGPLRDPETGMPTGIDGSEANCRRAIEGSLKRLNTDVIDLYYLHRVDPNTPIEETVGAMAKLVKEGKVRHLGLSEASGDTLKRAAAVHPIAAVQSEYSLFSRDIETALIPELKALNVSLVAYSPLGRGMLAGKFTAESLSETDWRTMNPRFQGEAFEANLALVEEVKAVAANKDVHPAQIALSWVLGRGEHVLCIPGTTKVSNLESNLAAADVSLSGDEKDRLDSLADRVQGLRYPETMMASTNA